MPSVSPPHDTSVTTKTINVKDVSNTLAQNINPLTSEDLKKILDQSTLQANLCDNPILVSVEELQKAVTKVTREKVKTQEPTYVIPSATSVKTLTQTIVDTFTKVDTSI